MAGAGISMADADIDGIENTPIGSSSVTSGSSPEMSSSSDDDADFVGSDSDEDMPVEDFPADEQETADTTARQHYEEGKDQQGIPWERLQVSRDEYRQQRIQRYRNYMNVIPEDDCPAVRAELTAGWPQPTALSDPQWPYAFLRNWRTVASSIVHFQLRNLLWAASAHDVAIVYDNRVQHWNSVTRSVTDVLDLRGWPKGPRLPGLSRVQVSTLCVHEGLLAAGGFSGELVLASMQHTEQGPAWDHEAQHSSSQPSGQVQQQQQQQEEEAGMDSMMDSDGQEAPMQQQQKQEQDQQALMIQQQVMRAANQLYPGARLQDWQPYQEQWAALAWPQQPQGQGGQQGQQEPANARQQQLRPPQQCQQHSLGPPAAPWQRRLPGQGQGYSPMHHQQQQQQQPQWQLHKRQHSSPRAPTQQGWQQQQQRQRHDQQRHDEAEALMGAAGPSAARVLHCCRVTQSENGITNGIEIFDSCNFGHCVMTSNNDCCVRLFDVEGCRPRQRLPFNFAVNYATLRPAGAAPGGGAVAAVVGDDPLTRLVDLRCGVQVMQLGGHRDFSFAAAWHPNGHLLATGNQDSTTRVWDLRSPSEPLAVMGGTMGAIRSLRFSPDGAYLAAAEPADFVHVYDVASGFGSVQAIDLFGEVAGISFSPDSQCFFVAISDTLYNSLVQYQRVT